MKKGEVSPPEHKVKLVKNVMIPMRDGVRLAADLIMPEKNGRYPALIQYHPYRKDDVSIGNNDAHYFFAERGYVGVRLDVRGTGSSEGICREEYSPEEIRDGQDAVNWLAKQQWCTGKTGMFGWSYSGQTTMMTAMHAPPSLKAIICAYFSWDRYKDDENFAGGSLIPWIDYGTYGPLMNARNALPPYLEYSGKEWAELWKLRLENMKPWQISWLEHQLDGKYWHSGSVKYHHDKVKAATFLIGGWRDGFPSPTMRMYQALKCPKKLLVGPWLHSRPDQGVPGPRIHIHHEMLRWWDYWLKDIDTGIMEEPPVSIYVQRYDRPSANRSQTSGAFRFEDGWPITRTRKEALYFHRGGVLDARLPSRAEASDSYEYRPQAGIYGGLFSATAPHVLPSDQRLDEALGVNYTTKPLKNDLEVTGFAEAVLSASSTAKVASFVVKLSDVVPDGSSALVTKGVLNATRRNSYEKPEALVPNKAYELAFELNATSWLFEKGHRIRVSVQSSDWPNMWPTPYLSMNTVYHGGSRRSRIILPVIPQDKRLRKPRYQPPVELHAPAEFVVKPDEFRVALDYYRKRVTIIAERSTFIRLSDIGAEVESNLRAEAGGSTEVPWDAYIKGKDTITLMRRDHVVDVVGEGLLTSTEESYHLIVNVEVKQDGVHVFSKNWTRVFDRKLS